MLRCPTHLWTLDVCSKIFKIAACTSVCTCTCDYIHVHCILSLSPSSLSPFLQARLSTALSGLDSADHNNRQEIINLRRPFLLLGSCLFYRGASACSHLRVEQLKEVIRFCQAYRLLELTAVKSINQVVIWREVCSIACTFMLHLYYFVFIVQVYLSQLEPAEEDDVYLPHDGRTFLLIVGLEHTLVCMLMQQMKLHPSGEVTPPTIDAVYVDRARSLIMELKAQDLLAECDGRSVSLQ